MFNKLRRKGGNKNKQIFTKFRGQSLPNI